MKTPEELINKPLTPQEVNKEQLQYVETVAVAFINTVSDALQISEPKDHYVYDFEFVKIILSEWHKKQVCSYLKELYSDYGWNASFELSEKEDKLIIHCDLRPKFIVINGGKND